MKDYYVIGLMSGTSIDGVDLVYVNFFFINIGVLKS
jgi:1,6-anhydro-N-acetylmuramate kinase